MWKEGSLKVGNSVFHFWAKCFDEPSEFGIDGGKVSKLMLKRNTKVAYNYDRGLDVAPADEDTEIALAILLKEYN